VFVSLRTDKRPEECRREAPGEATVAAAPEHAPAAVEPAPAVPKRARAAPERAAAPRERASATPEGRTAAPSAREITISNATKVFWPAQGYTKGDLIEYYRTVAPLLVPYLADRPLVLTRYPDGISGKSFFQQDAPHFVPSWVRTARIYSKESEREIGYFVVDDVETLTYVVNLGTIVLHSWSARLASLERPDWLVLDLDPKDAPFTRVIEVAQIVRRTLDDLGLPSYVKTSGATGLHILLPLGARYSHEQTRTFARLLAVLTVEEAPAIATVARPIRSRERKVYVDFGQNGHGRTIVAPYSARPRPGAPVSCPLAWEEVGPDLDPARFTIETLPARFQSMADPLAPVLAEGIDMEAAVARVEQRLARSRRK